MSLKIGNIIKNEIVSYYHEYLVVGLLFFISIINEKLFFEFHFLKESMETLFRYFCFRLLFVVILVIFVKNVSHCIRNVKKKNPKYVLGLKIMLLFVAIYGGVFFLTWPGNWNNDEFIILNKAMQLNFAFEQGSLMSVFYIISLMIIPNAGGVIFFQALICIFIATYISTELWFESKILAIVTILTFCTIQTIYFILYPLRVTLFTFLILLGSFMILSSKNKVQKWSLKKVGIFSIVVVIGGFFRPEGFLFLLCFSFWFILSAWGQKAKTLLYASLALGLSFVILVVNLGYDNDVRQWKMAMSFIGPLQEISKYEEEEAFKEREWQSIDRVLDIDVLRSMDIEKEFYESLPVFREKWPITSVEYKEFMLSIVKLFFKYPKYFIESKWWIFKSSVGINPKFSWNPIVTDDETREKILRGYDIDDSINRYTQPIFPLLRIRIFSFLAGYHKVNNQLTYYLFWNQICVTLIALFAMILGVFLNFKKYIFILISYFGSFLLVYLTMPLISNMYFFVFYQTGFIVIIMFIVEILKKYNLLSKKQLIDR